MKFERLRLHGFKSFCDQTDLVLEPGLTGVVGPNGCGKSNLVEAMRWVMGESSYKAMRASGMDDVIFSGSSNRPGRNSAEVTLILDNSDRSAPAALNVADTLEVTRRIEREQGSVYRVNGREVRARDVQLLFADASTGAHSPALVRQGQIGELISSKPVKRRALLEEAAGISGLHSRRHEAELRLRGAEQNLERVDDIIAQVESQLDTLKRQARLATRYRSISGDIRKAEAALYHVRWVAARAGEKQTEALQGQMVSQLADATHVEREAAKLLEAEEAAQQPLREAEAAAGAAAQRLNILREQLEDEIRRADSRRAELQDRQTQLAADLEREQQLAAESAEIIGRYTDEQARLTAEGENQAEAETQARQAAEAAAATLSEIEKEAAAATEALAQLRAARGQAERNANDARARAERLRNQIAEVEKEAQSVRAELDADQSITARRQDLEKAHAASSAAENSALTAEEQTAASLEALNLATPELSELEGQLGRLESEADTLARVLNVTDGNLWPSIVDQLEVQPGFETALGAALGDDLDASSDQGAPIHWREVDGSSDAALPEGVEPLSRFVTGADVLNRNLGQVGLVSAADGPKLMHSLKPGQRLVTLEGDLWRWDGLVAQSDAPTNAAQRLAQRNRLADLDSEIASTRAEVDKKRKAVAQLKETHQQSQAEERQRREDYRSAQHQIADTQSLLDIAQKALGDLTTRQGALEEAKVRLKSSLSETEAIAEDAEKSLAGMDTLDAVSAKVAAAQQKVQQARSDADHARLNLGGFENAARARRDRIAQLSSEIATWQGREKNAAQQLERLQARAGEIAQQLDELAALPDGFAEKRQTLDEQIAEANALHQKASDALAGAQTRYREADRASRLANQSLNELKAEMARVDERLKGLMVQRQQIEQVITENLGIPASKTAEVAGIKPESALPQEHDMERRVERLKAERERLGGVNLSAEKEAEEVKEKLETMLADRDDLIAAISKLRTGISSLNREGRARLNDAFDKVNAHFSDLFTTLFGGGTAELTFVESEDPLEAGLEILARPPGKKPQTLTLLSGGEQALTAMALIFAVFLTNPAPICVLDEVDAPLDDANVERFCNLLDSMVERTDTRFVVITHNPITMARVDRLFGVTMAERGVSQLVSIDLTTAHAVREAV